MSSSFHRPGVHEGMVVSVVKGEVVEGGVLGTHGVGGVRAGGAVVPGEGHHGPAVVEVGGENEAVVVTLLSILRVTISTIYCPPCPLLVLGEVPDDGGHLGLRGLALQLPEAAAELRPVGEAAVEVLV